MCVLYLIGLLDLVPLMQYFAMLLEKQREIVGLVVQIALFVLNILAPQSKPQKK